VERFRESVLEIPSRREHGIRSHAAGLIAGRMMLEGTSLRDWYTQEEIALIRKLA